MNNYAVTCCSTADMSPDFFSSKGISYACFHYQMDGKEYTDDLGKTIPFDRFYQMVAAGSQPVTSQVNMDEYMELFEPFLKEGRDVLHITLSGGISGSINSANLAKEQLEEQYPDRKIFIVDSYGASSGYGLLVTTAWEKMEQGVTLEENVKWLEENKRKLHHWFFSTDLTSYIRGGRISRVSGFIGQALSICPLLNMNTEGKLIPRTKHRGKKQVIREMIAKMEQHAEGGLAYSGKCYISQSACLEDARTVADQIEQKFPNLDGKVVINSVGTVIGSHTGPGTVALFFWGDERTI